VVLRLDAIGVLGLRLLDLPGVARACAQTRPDDQTTR
jgi:hypothetical protein